MSKEVAIHTDKRLREVIKLSSVAIARLTVDGTVTYASPSTEQVTGYTAEELVGRNGFALLHPEDVENARQQFTGILDRPGHSITLESRFRHADGTWRWVEAILTNLLDDPAVGAVVSNYCDITRRKQGQGRLQQSEESYRVLVKQAAVGIFVTDLQGHVVEVNEVGCQLSGYSREELLTRHMRDLVPEEDHVALFATLEGLRAGGITYKQWQMKRKDGSLLPVEASANPLSTGHLLLTVHDISHRIQPQSHPPRLLASEQAARVEAEAATCRRVGGHEAMRS